MRLSAVAMIAVTVLLSSCSREAPPPEPVRAVRTLAVASEAAVLVQEYAAEVRPRTESRLGFRVGGKLVRRLVDLGDVVKPGQALAQLDARDLQLGQESAQAGLNAARVNLELAEADFRRYRELREQNYISAAELERRETTLKSARAQFEQARAQAGVQSNQRGYSVLTADAAGVVTAVEAEPGAVVAAGTPIVRLAPDGPRDVVFSVPEGQVDALRQLAARQGSLRVRLWDSAQPPLPATVREVAASADPATRTFLVKADVGHAPVRLGQTATVLVEWPQAEAGIRLPLSALVEQQGRTSVWLLDPNSMTVRPQPIEIGPPQGDRVLVKGGLQPGQEVVTAGVHTLSPGQQVKRYVEPRAVSAGG
jgi:RND family efflux transporter MFP subunit